MKFFIALFALFAIAQCRSFSNDFQDQWLLFKDRFDKSYSDDIEEDFRRQIFAENTKKIADHNTLFARGEKSYELKINKFGDLLTQEFAHMMNGYRYSNVSKGLPFVVPEVEIPETVDWRTKGYVTPVKDQGQCGSCWAFSTTGSLEGQHFKKTGKLVSLSEQNLVDCSWAYGNMGCNGGLMDSSFKYIKANGGIDTEETYPYEHVDNKCRFKKATIGATDTGFVDISSGDEDALKKAVATIGPISVAIDASHWSFQFYHRGVYDEGRCSSTRLDHGVLAVGYGTSDEGKDFWLVKNSWGPTWGEDGYIMMTRNMNNQCGIATDASYPLV